MKIDITQEDHAALMELLNDIANIRYDQAAALIGHGAEDRVDMCIQQAHAAARLFMQLAKY